MTAAGRKTMRRQLVVIYGSLLMAVLFALTVPLAITSLDRAGERMTADRLADASYLAAIAGPAIRTGELVTLATTLSRYEEVYGMRAFVVDVDLALASSPGRGRHFPLKTEVRSTTDVESAGLRTAIDQALAGDQVTSPPRIWPWGPRQLTVAVPVRDNGQVVGAVVTLSPTERLRSAAARTWMLLAAMDLVPIALGLLAATKLARWTLQPVKDLDSAAHALAAGAHGVRVHADAGPSELRWLAMAFNHMVDTVTDAFTRQREFVSHASHQLRNPLTALMLRLEELGEQPMSNEGREQYRFAIEEVVRLRGILDALLAMARAERGSGNTESVDAVALARSRIDAWRPLAQAKNVTLTLVAPANPVAVLSVATGLEQTLDALLDNALKFGARTVTVQVTAGTHPQVHVVDDGPGITSAHLKQAPERFWRAPDTQNLPGHGLGLAIATALTTAAGGTLSLRNANQGGLDVGLELVSDYVRETVDPPTIH